MYWRPFRSFLYRNDVKDQLLTNQTQESLRYLERLITDYQNPY